MKFGWFVVFYDHAGNAIPMNHTPLEERPSNADLWAWARWHGYKSFKYYQAEAVA